MSSLYISEYRRVGREAHGGPGATIPAPLEPAIRNQKISISGTSSQSKPFDPETALVLVSADAVCSIKFGEDPVAKTTDFRMPADSGQFFSINPKSGLKIAVVSNT